MEELSLSACLIVLPVALVASIIYPDHVAAAVAQTTFPLALVDSPGFVCVHFVLELSIVLISPTQRFFGLIALEILALDFTCQLHNAVLAPLQEASNQGLDRDDFHHILLGYLATAVSLQAAVDLLTVENYDSF